MASNSPGGGDGVIVIVCGALRAKLNTKNLSCGTSRCISREGEILTPCEFERRAGNLHQETGKIRFVLKKDLYLVIWKHV